MDETSVLLSVDGDFPLPGFVCFFVFLIYLRFFGFDFTPNGVLFFYGFIVLQICRSYGAVTSLHDINGLTNNLTTINQITQQSNTRCDARI